MAAVNPMQRSVQTMPSATTPGTAQRSSNATNFTVSNSQISAIEAELTRLESAQTREEPNVTTAPKTAANDGDLKQETRKAKLIINRLIQAQAGEIKRELMINTQKAGLFNRRKKEIAAGQEAAKNLTDLKNYLTNQPLNNLDNINEAIIAVNEHDGDNTAIIEELNSLKTAFVLANPQAVNRHDLMAVTATLEPESPEAIKLQEHLAETSTAEYQFSSEGLDGDIWGQYAPSYTGTNGYYSTQGMISGLMNKANVGGAYGVMNQYYGGLGVSA